MTDNDTNTKNEPLVSVIVPVFNTRNFIIDSIYSVINQTYSNWELIIVNDNSTDDSYELIKYCISCNNVINQKVKIINNTSNLGVVCSRNIGVEVAKGDFIAFLDSDDIWHRDKLKKQINFMKKNNINWSFTNYQRITENNEYLKKVLCPLKKIEYSSLLRSNYIGILTTVYCCKSIGKQYFQHNKFRREDYLLWIKLVNLGEIAYLLPEVLAYYRVRKASMSSNKIKMLKKNIQLLSSLRLNVFQIIYYSTTYIIQGILKRLGM